MPTPSPRAVVDELNRLGVDMAALRQSAQTELDRRRKAQHYLQNPFLWLREVCCDPDKKKSLNIELHGGGLKFINQPQRRKLILWPRGHLKSTTFTVAEALRRAVLNPNIRILISSAKWENAKGFLSDIKSILRRPEFIALYDSLLPGPNEKYHKNNDAAMSLLTKTTNFTQATFTTTGMDAEKTSQHYDLIIHDDVVARDNVSNDAQMNKVIQYYKDCVSLLDPKREMWVIGTRWHPLDLYGWLLSGATDPRCRETDFNPHHEDCKCRFAVSVRKLKEDDQYIFPEKFDDEVMSDLVEVDQLDRYSLACQYFNNPTDPSTCWFRSTDIEASLIDAAEITSKRDDLQWYAAIDPAESTESRACLSAAVAVGIDPKDGTWYVDWAEGKRVETSGFLNLCMDTWRRYRPSKFGMELNTRKHLAFALKQQMLETGDLFHIEELKPQRVGDAKRTKDERIKRLVPMFEYKKIRINRTLKQLLDELYTIPASTSRDLCDALSYILDLAPPGLGYRGKADVKLPKRKIGWKVIGY